MKNIIYYMKKFGDRTLDEIPFNEVDSLILCQLSYLNYENLIVMFVKFVINILNISKGKW